MIKINNITLNSNFIFEVGNQSPIAVNYNGGHVRASINSQNGDCVFQVEVPFTSDWTIKEIAEYVQNEFDKIK